FGFVLHTQLTTHHTVEPHRATQPFGASLRQGGCNGFGCLTLVVESDDCKLQTQRRLTRLTACLEPVSGWLLLSLYARLPPHVDGERFAEAGVELAGLFLYLQLARGVVLDRVQPQCFATCTDLAILEAAFGESSRLVGSTRVLVRVGIAGNDDNRCSHEHEQERSRVEHG